MKPLVKYSLSIFCLISCVGILSAQSNTEKVSTYFEQIQNNEALLNHFFMKMPKGGDLHNHLTGSAYAETYFTLAVDDQLVFLWYFRVVCGSIRQPFGRFA